jgi:hypothetical protein
MPRTLRRPASAHDVKPSDEHDSPWKDAIEGAFPEFMAFYFPAAHAAIDWTRAHTFLNQELRKVVRDAASGKKFVDVLVRVTGLDQAERLLYVHVEVQTQRDEAFARRMFTYHHRLIDRWGQAVASFAVLADDSPLWRPSEYRTELLGCEHWFRFPTAKLLDHEPRLTELQRNSNPFALVTAAHLMTLRTRHDDQRRFAAKRQLVKLLYAQGWNRQRVINLFAIIDWMLALPKPLEQQVWQDIEDIERKADMKYVTSVERLAIERGMAQGLEKGLEKGMEKGMEKGLQRGREQGRLDTLTRQLTRRFGPLPDAALARLQSATPDQLDLWTDRVLDAPTLEAVLGGH